MSPCKLFTVALALLAVDGCQVPAQILPANKLPVAKAQMIGPDGATLFDPLKPCSDPNTKPNPAHEVKFDYAGTPIEITLDGSASTDEDGKILKYHWQSGASVPDAGEGNLSHDMEVKLPDGGSTTKHIKAGGRLIPAGEDVNWPNKDTAKVSVALGEGLWAFDLWVTDDKGSVSKPDSVTISIGGDPRVTACVASVYPMVSDACKTCICSQSDTCRMNAAESVCDAMCWGLLNCIGANCKDFAAMAMKMDYSCLTSNCSAFLSGGTGATAIGPCVTACPSDCTSMSMAMTCDGGVPEGGTPAPDSGK